LEAVAIAFTVVAVAAPTIGIGTLNRAEAVVGVLPSVV
jgi:hypothetical protein